METVFDALKALKRASSQEVSARLGISREDAVNELWKLKRRGEADNKGSMWWLTDTGNKTAEKADAEVKTGAFIQNIPSLTGKRASDPVRVTLHMANRELRRAKGHVQKLERVCAALRELNKHRDIMQQITTGGDGKA